jgi:hypothetical protein
VYALGPFRRQVVQQLCEVAVGVTVRRDALVDLEDRDLLPWHPPGQRREHRPGRAAARNGEREAAAPRDRLGRGLCDHLGAASGHGLRVRQDLDLERHQPVFSACPPNCLRSADSRRFSKSSSPREENRE